MSEPPRWFAQPVPPLGAITSEGIKNPLGRPAFDRLTVLVREAAQLRELALLFARLGATAFGGPAVHISMMRDEVVMRRKWLTEERFLDLLGATNLIPGPNSTELAIHIGWERRRWAGLFVAGLAFIVPAMLITGTLGYVYVRFGSVPAAAGAAHSL